MPFFCCFFFLISSLHLIAVSFCAAEFRGSSPIVYLCRLPVLCIHFFILHIVCDSDFDTSYCFVKISKWKIMTKTNSNYEDDDDDDELEFQLLIAFEIYSILIYGRIFYFRWTDRCSNLLFFWTKALNLRSRLNGTNERMNKPTYHSIIIVIPILCDIERWNTKWQNANTTFWWIDFKKVPREWISIRICWEFFFLPSFHFCYCWWFFLYYFYLNNAAAH